MKFRHHITLGIPKPETKEEIELERTVNGMRRAIDMGARDSGLIRHALDAARFSGYSGEDTYVLLAYQALRQLEDVQKRFFEYVALSPFSPPIVAPDTVLAPDSPEIARLKKTWDEAPTLQAKDAAYQALNARRTREAIDAFGRGAPVVICELPKEG